MAQTDVAAVRTMITTYGVQETMNKLSKEGLSKEQINGLITAVFEGKNSPAIDVVEFTMDVNGKKVGMKAPVGFDTVLPMNDQADAFASKGYYSIKTEGDKLYGVFATGEVDKENPLADVKKEHTKALRSEAEKFLEESQAWRDAQAEAAKNLGIVAVVGIGISAFAAIATEYLAAKGVSTAVRAVAIDIASKEAPKMALNGYLNKAAVASLLVTAFTSCNKIDMGQDETQITKQKDYTDQLNQLHQDIQAVLKEIKGQRADIAELRNDVNSGFEQLSDNDKQIINDLDNIYARMEEIGVNIDSHANDVKTLLRQVNAWLETIQANQDTQIELQLAHGNNFVQFVNDLFEILNDMSLNDKEKYQKILEKMQDIENVNINTNEKITEISEKIDKLKGKFDTFDDSAILEAIDKLVQQGAQANAMLELIYDAMGAIGDDSKKYFGDLINAVVKNGSKIDDLKALLNAINNSVKNGTEVQKQNAKAILEKLDELGFNVVDGMDKITQAVQAGNVKLDTIITILNDIKGLVCKYGENGNKLGNAILAAIGKINFTATVDLSGIEKLLKELGTKQDATTGEVTKLTNLFNKFSGTTAAQLNTIIAKMGSGSAKLDDIINLLVAMDANQEARNQKVLAAIEKLGGDVTTDLTAILNAINSIPQAEQKDYSAALNAILDKIKEGNANNNANFKAVLDAIEKHGAKVTVGMNAILDAIKNQPDYSTKLDAILKRLDALGAKAQEILEAIKDHDVKITVDVTGKVKCECNCNCGDGGKHEGIIGNLNDLLG